MDNIDLSQLKETGLKQSIEMVKFQERIIIGTVDKDLSFVRV